MGVTSPETFLAELAAAVRQTHESGGFTEVLRLAQERQLELQAELATLTVGHHVRYVTSRECDELRHKWTPEQAQLNERIAELNWQIRKWAYVEDRSREYAANEAHGWTILANGTSAKALSNGRV